MTIYIEVSMHCPSCQRDIDPKVVTENDLRRGTCFACHLKGVSFGFRGVSYGRSSWNDTTLREVHSSHEKGLREGKIEKVSARKELI